MRALRAYIDFCRRHGQWLIGAAALLSVLALGLASQLGIQADMARLLPESAPSVVGLERLDRSYGGQIGRLTVVLQADQRLAEPAATLQSLADRLDERLSRLDGVTRVEARRPIDYFERHRLLYADFEDLQKTRRRLDERLAWEKAKRNPLFVELGDQPPPEVDFSDLAGEYRAFVPSTHFISPNGRMLAVFVYPSFPASELERAEQLVDEVDALVRAELRAEQHVEFGLTGRYKKRIDLQSMLQRDLTVSTSLALVLILAFLFFFLRSLRGTLVVIVPLVVGTVWAFAWAHIIFGSLNILTAFLGAVLMGLGVDYGIHLYSRYHELADRADTEEALTRTLATTGRANLFAALTTIVALGSLIVSDFRAFFEFGIIALGGLLLILVAYLVLFPCIVFWAHQHHANLPPPASGAFSQALSERLTRGEKTAVDRRFRRINKAARVGLIGLVLAASLGFPQVGFERDFSVIQSTSAPSWQLDEHVNRLVGRSQTPAVVLTDSERQAQQLAGQLERRFEQHPKGYTVAEVVSLASFVPERQLAKLKLLGEIRNKIAGLPKSARQGKLQAYLSEIEQVLAAGRVGAQDLPTQVREPFSRKDKPTNAVVLIFPAISLSDMDAVEDYAALLRDLPGVERPGYDAISDALLLSDVITMAERDAYWMLAITVAGFLLLSVVGFRRRRLIFLQLAILALAILVAIGINGLFGVDFNFMNIVILPIWIGLGVDAAFHLLMHVENGDHLRPHINVAMAVSAGYFTSILGFSTLLLARHNGLQSLGQVAVLGLGSILVINLLVHTSLVAGERDSQHSSDRSEP